MSFPELLALAGFILVLLGVAVIFLAAIKAMARPEGRETAMGLILLGPIPVLVKGKWAKAFTILTAAVVLAFLAVLLILALEVTWP